MQKNNLTYFMLTFLSSLIFNSTIAFADVTTTQVKNIHFGTVIPGSQSGWIKLLNTGTTVSNLTHTGGEQQGSIQCTLTGTSTSARLTSNPTFIYIPNSENPSANLKIKAIISNIDCTTITPTVTLESQAWVSMDQYPGTYSGEYSASANPNGSGSTITFTGNVSINIGTPIAVTQANGIDFGTFAPSSVTPGTITINPTSGAISSSNVEILTSGARGTYNVTGNGGQNYTYSMSPTIVTLNGPGPNSMALNLSSGGSGTLSTGGTDTFYLGGTLTVGVSQAAGTYSGSFTVTVDY